MVVLRRLVGDVLRRHRIRQGRTLREVSAAAQVSLGYLSEVERGRKEASSELLAAICVALGVSLADVLREVSDDLAALEPRPSTAIGFVPVAGGKVARAGAVAGLAPLLPTRVSPSPAPAPAPVASLSSTTAAAPGALSAYVVAAA